ncbi:MAG: endonuclease [Bacteroidota bacterium]
MPHFTTYFTVLLLSLSSFGLFAQGHQPVFPDLDGQDLLEAVQDNFTPASVLSFSNARDTLFGSVYQVGDSLRGVYTDWPVYMPPGADPTQAAFQNGAGLNTEHSWPRANGAEFDPARADMHHLFPTRVDVNGDRGNLPFGEISDVLTDRWYYLDQEQTVPPSENRAAFSEYRQNVAFEPREAFKGNIARAMMYFYTIYRDEANAAAPNFFNQQRATLCQWHEQDPVDELEWQRTFAIAVHQDDKPNPFVLDCTLAARVYCPELTGTECITSVDDDLVPSIPAFFSPNPSKGTGVLTIDTPERGQLSLDYFDTSGRLRQTETMSVPAGQLQLPLQLPAPGFWYCRLTLNGQSQVYVQQLRLIVID